MLLFPHLWMSCVSALSHYCLLVWGKKKRILKIRSSGILLLIFLFTLFWLVVYKGGGFEAILNTVIPFACFVLLWFCFFFLNKFLLAPSRMLCRFVFQTEWESLEVPFQGLHRKSDEKTLNLHRHLIYRSSGFVTDTFVCCNANTKTGQIIFIHSHEILWVLERRKRMGRTCQYF